MPRFGTYLIKAALLRREQLEEALQHQAVYGARLGTALVELGMLSIEQLAESLSDFHKSPLPPRKWLAKPQRTAIRRVSRPLVERVRFVPLRLDGNLLHVATLDPRDPRVLDDLRFATGCRIEPYVLPEIWMHDWLLALFDIPRGIRHIEIAASAPQPVVPDQAPEAFEPSPRMAAAAAPRAAAERPPRSVGEAVQRASRAPAAAKPAPREQANVPVLRPGAAATAAAAPPVPMPMPVPMPAPIDTPGASVRPPAVTVHSLSDIAAAMARPDFSKYGAAATMVAEPRSLPDWEPPTQNHELVRTLSEAPELTFEAAPEPSFPRAAAMPPALPTLSEPPPPPPAPTKTPTLIPPPPTLAPPPPEAPAPPVASPRLMELEAALLRVDGREPLIETALQIASGFAQHVALFIVQRGLMQGVRCLERGEPRPIDSVIVPLSATSMLTLAATSAEPLRLDPRERAFDARVLELLGDPAAIDAGLYPVALKQRVVNVLYASNGEEPLGPIAFAALAALAQEMGMAYGRLILSRKGGAQ